MLIAAEISAASVVIQYWTTSVPVAVWITIILVLIVILNIFVVSIYGESEFWFASIKIIAIVGLIVLGIVLFFGGYVEPYSRLLAHVLFVSIFLCSTWEKPSDTK